MNFSPENSPQEDYIHRDCIACSITWRSNTEEISEKYRKEFLYLTLLWHSISNPACKLMSRNENVPCPLLHCNHDEISHVFAHTFSCHITRLYRGFFITLCKCETFPMGHVHFLTLIENWRTCY